MADREAATWRNRQTAEVVYVDPKYGGRPERFERVHVLNDAELAAHDREVAAEALRGAADEMPVEAEAYPESVWPDFGPDDEVREDWAAASMARHLYRKTVPAILRDRAQAIEEGT